MSKIPKNWKDYSFGDIVKFSGGAQPPRSTFKFESTENYIRLIQTRDYKSDKYKTYIPLEFARKKCLKDDIMIGRYGPPIFQILRGLEGAYNVALLKAIPDETQLYKEYLFYYISQYSVWSFVENLSQRSGGQTGVDLEQLRKYPFPLPPLPEQQKIADILSTVDAKIEVIDQQITETQELKKGLMQRLLIKGIGHTEFKDSALGEIPVGWEVKEVDEVGIELIDGDRGTNYPKSKDFSSQGYCLFLSAKNVTKKGFKFNECQFISEERDSLLRKGKLSKYDFIITTRGSVGHVAFYDDSVPFEHIRLNSGMVILRDSKKNYDTKFLYQFMKSPVFDSQVEFITSGSAQPQLTIKGLKKLKLPILPIREQLEIGELLTTISNKLEVLSEKKETYQELKKGLMQQLLTGKVRVKV